MVSHSLRVIGLVVICALGLQSHAQTAGHKSTSPLRLESVTIGELGTEVRVQFDRPISHGLSWLSLVRDGKVVANMHPRLEAAPNVLFARFQTPTAGNYIVRWTVCPEGSNDRYDGEFPITVGDAAASTANYPRKEHE